MNMRSKILIVIAIAICAVAFFLGSNSDKKEEAAAKPQQEKQTTTEYASQETGQVEEKETIEKGGPSQDELFSKEELDASKKVAVDFVKVYHNYDASQPFKNLENSKRFIDEYFYIQLQKNISRGTLDAVKKKWTNVGVTETSNTSREKLIWNVVVQSENTDNDGKTWTGEDWYLVELKKEGNEYKVTGVTVNAAH